MRYALLIAIIVLSSCKTTFFVKSDFVYAEFVKAERTETNKLWSVYSGDKFTLYTDFYDGEHISAIIPVGKNGRTFQIKKALATIMSYDVFDYNEALTEVMLSIDGIAYRVKLIGHPIIGQNFYVWIPK